MRVGPFAVLALVQCTQAAPPSTPGPAPAPATPSSTSPTASTDTTYVVGVLGQFGTPDCTPTEKRFVDIYPVVGETPIAIETLPQELLDTAVIASGRVEERNVGPATSVHECPIAQTRSDWLETPRGLHKQRARSGPTIPSLRVAEMRPLAELTIRATKDEVTVEFRNPVPVALEAVELVAHYEGCFGKPGTATRREEVGKLAIGAGTRAIFPTIVEAERAPGRPEAHLADSLQILATGEHVVFDLDVPIRGSAGSELPCPNE
jgi:hypothetical protein